MAVIAYEYEVAGTTHRSSRLDFAGEGIGETAGGALLRHDHAEPIDVRFHPRRPSLSVLQTGVGFGNYARLILASIVLGVGAMFLLAALWEPAS